MGWGIELRNNANRLQIDQDYQSMVALHDPVSLLMPNINILYLTGSPFPSYYPNIWPSAPLPNMSLGPILWNQALSTGCSTAFTTNGSSITTIGAALHPNRLNQTVRFCWSIISPNGPLAFPSNWGIKVFKPNGVESFDSRKRHVIIRDVLYIPSHSWDGRTELYYDMPHAPCAGTPWYAASIQPSGPYSSAQGDDNHISSSIITQVLASDRVRVWRVREFVSDLYGGQGLVIVADIL